MRTVNDVITYVNDIKPNAFTEETLTEWLSECEGSIQTEILCIASGDVVTYSYADNKDTELIVKPPHDKLYGFYLIAMIDFAHGEYKKYENTMQLFNAALSEFAKWFVRTHSKEAKSPEGYYMSGYDLAVKHGYSGSEEEWLKTLIGPQGERGIQGEKGDRGIPGKIQSVTSGDNGKILVDGKSVVVYDDSEIKEEIGGKVDKASGKGLSSNDYTDAEKNKLANLSNYDDTEIKNDINGKVDKITGKGLSTNDYTDEEKEKLKGLSNYDDTEIKNEIGGKVDKVQGKGLSSNDYTAEEKIKLSELPTKTELDTDLSGKEDTANKVTTLDENSTDTQYPSAKATYDELVKKADMQNSRGGFAGGKNASAYYGGAVGNGAQAQYGGAVGMNAESHNGGAVGNGAVTSNGFAGGYNAKAEKDYLGINAIQLGTGTNENEKTLQIYKYQLMDAKGHIPNERMPTKVDKISISTSTETTPSLILSEYPAEYSVNNTETRYEELTSLTVTKSNFISDSFISSVVFKSGATATTVTVPSDVYCQGADCKNGAFLPKANKRYTMIFSYDGIMNCYIAAVPIQTAETQSADDFPAANDESVAEPTESVAEEPESEPNEVI